MPLSWNEIRQRATTFAQRWADAARERAGAQTFWNEFFEVFGMRRRTVAAFEAPVRNLQGATDFIDLLRATGGAANGGGRSAAAQTRRGEGRG